MQKQKAIFLDRDGVLNKERGDYTYKLEDFIIEEGVKEALEMLKKAGFLLMVVTNQGGIAKGIYTAEDVKKCHQKLQIHTNFLLDALYYAPSHEAYSHSLSRKPDSLMFEKAIHKFQIDVSQSWVIGDGERDMLAGKKVGIKGVLVAPNAQVTPTVALQKVANLLEAAIWLSENGF